MNDRWNGRELRPSMIASFWATEKIQRTHRKGVTRLGQTTRGTDPMLLPITIYNIRPQISDPDPGLPKDRICIPLTASACGVTRGDRSPLESFARRESSSCGNDGAYAGADLANESRTKVWGLSNGGGDRARFRARAAILLSESLSNAGPLMARICGVQRTSF